MTTRRIGNGPGQGTGHGGPAQGSDRRHPDFAPGNEVAVTHGAYSPARVSAKAAELLPEVEAMVEGMPASAPAFTAARGLLALRLARLALVTEWMAERDVINEHGEGIPALALEARMAREVERSLAALGLDVVSAARVGVDVVRARDLASSLRELDQDSR